MGTKNRRGCLDRPNIRRSKSRLTACSKKERHPIGCLSLSEGMTKIAISRNEITPSRSSGPKPKFKDSGFGLERRRSGVKRTLTFEKNRSKRYKACSGMVPPARIELTTNP